MFAGTAIMGLAVAATWQFIACVPFPSTQGFASLGRGDPGRTDLAIHGFGISTGGTDGTKDWDEGGGGGISVDPFVTERLSAPITLSGGGGRGEDANAGGGTLRIGFRYRALPWVGVGAGLSFGIYGYDTSSEISDFYGSAIIDAEVLAGFEMDRFALTFAVRPSSSFPVHDADEGSTRYLFLPIDLAIAVFVLPGRFAITFHGGGGFYSSFEDHASWNGWGGGGLGLYVRL